MVESFQERLGSWALVTGASSGIGAAFARALASRGLNVVLVARGATALAQLGEELERTHSVQTLVLVEDLGERAASERVLAATSALDVGLVVLSAGYGSCGPLIDSDVSNEASMVDLNCRAVLLLSHGFGQRLAQRRRGALVLLSSLVAFQGAPFAANYAATKAYVQSLAEALRVELSPRGVSVVACAPGPVRSGFSARANMQLGPTDAPDTVAQQTLQRLHAGSTVRPGRVAKLLGYSLSTLPRFVRVRVMGKIMSGMVKPVAQGTRPVGSR